VHVDLDEAGRPRLTHVLRGERVHDVLEYVEYFESDLLSNLRRSVENSLEEGRITFEESALIYARYEAGLHGYTYLVREKNGKPEQSYSLPTWPAQVNLGNLVPPPNGASPASGDPGAPPAPAPGAPQERSLNTSA